MLTGPSPDEGPLAKKRRPGAGVQPSAAPAASAPPDVRPPRRAKPPAAAGPPAVEAALQVAKEVPQGMQQQLPPRQQGSRRAAAAQPGAAPEAAAGPGAAMGHPVLVKGLESVAGREEQFFRWVAQAVGALPSAPLFPAPAAALMALGLPSSSSGAAEACALLPCGTAEQAARVVQLLHGCTAVPPCGPGPHQLGAVTGKAAHQARTPAARLRPLPSAGLPCFPLTALSAPTAALLAPSWRRLTDPLVAGVGAQMKRWRLIVRNLAFAVTPESLRRDFSAAGFVWEAHLPRNERGQSRGFGFVAFVRREEAERALALFNGKALSGRPVAVDWALSKDRYSKAGEVRSCHLFSAYRPVYLALSLPACQPAGRLQGTGGKSAPGLALQALGGLGRNSFPG